MLFFVRWCHAVLTLRTSLDFSGQVWFIHQIHSSPVRLVRLVSRTSPGLVLMLKI
jgi:hypothetical protein